MSPSLPTPAFLYILNIFLSPTLPKFLFFHNCHATPKGHGLPPPQNSEHAPGCQAVVAMLMWFHYFISTPAIEATLVCYSWLVHQSACRKEFGIFAQRTMVDQAREGLCYQ